jgi:hypothetical protein
MLLPALIGAAVLLAAAPNVPVPVPATTPAPLAWPELTTPPGGVGPGKHDGVRIVAIGTYQHLPAIAGAAHLAAQYADWFKDARGVPAQRVKVLVDKEATEPAIRTALSQLFAAPNGTAWFVFIGHGMPNNNGDDGLILPVDVAANRSAVERFGISQQDIYKVVNSERHAAGVAVFDATFSRMRGDGQAPLVDGWDERLPNRHVRSPPRRTAVLAAHDGCAPVLPDAERPAFSYLLLGALQGWGDANGDSVVDSGEAMRFVQEAMPRCSGPEEPTPRWQAGVELALGKTARHRQDIDPLLQAMHARTTPTPTPTP